VATNLKKEVLLDFLRRMLTIREFEERLVGLYDAGHFKGHYHVYIGQEATGVAAISCLTENDYLFTTHRNHGHLLARGADPGRLLAEILGRRDGYNKGKGGSFHPTAAALGFLHTSAIVAGLIPLAAGAAYAAKARKTNQAVLCLFGDGALEEGAAAEGFNLAAVLRLPVLFLCENNGRGGRGGDARAARASSLAVYPVTDLPAAYKIPVVQVDGADPAQVHETVRDAIAKIRAGEGPRFIEAVTECWPGNAASWPKLPIRTNLGLAWETSFIPESHRAWYEHSDPLLLLARDLVKTGAVGRAEIERMHGDIRDAIERAVGFGLASPFPEPAEALNDVFA
jgi:pyruvate dehydrogenase E1 component alpha subunit